MLGAVWLCGMLPTIPLRCPGSVLGVVSRLCVVVSQRLFVLVWCKLVQGDLTLIGVLVCFVLLR